MKTEVSFIVTVDIISS